MLSLCTCREPAAGSGSCPSESFTVCQHPHPLCTPTPTLKWNGNGPVLSLLSYCFKESGETFSVIPVSIKNDQRAVPISKTGKKKKGKVLGGGYLQIRPTARNHNVPATGSIPLPRCV